MFKIIKMWIVLSLLIFSFCEKSEPIKPKVTIMAKIGDRVISSEEFIRRAEYTIRPPFCKGSNYIHKKIVLNSLIAEKLLALEAGDTNKLFQNDDFQKFIKGRKEQAMRQYQYFDKCFEKAVPDTSLIKNAFKEAGKKYKINYCTLPDQESAEKMAEIIKKGDKSFEDIVKEKFGTEEVPSREIEYFAKNEINLHKALYNNPLKKGEIIGPIKTEENMYVFMQVKGWTNSIAISDTDIKQRWNDVKEVLQTHKAKQIYTQYIQDVMSGKTMNFNKEALFELSDILAPVYIKTSEEQKDQLNDQMWGNKPEKESISAGDIRGKIENIESKSLFNIDGDVYTIKDFRDMLKSHPLVFRSRKMKKEKFTGHLRLAIADLIRDKYLTEEAYKDGLDKLESIQRNMEMWQDNMLATYMVKNFLDNSGFDQDFSKNYMSAIKNYLNPYIDSLQAKYSDQIEINTDEFEKIELTRIDLVALQDNVPYPQVVPGFPILTTDNQMNYGKILESE